VGRGGRGDDALGGLAVGALGGHLLALLAEDLDGGVEVAAGLLERPLAVHHADAGGLAEALDVLGGDLAHGVPGLREGERGNGGKGEGVGARPPPLSLSPSLCAGEAWRLRPRLRGLLLALGGSLVCLR